MKTTKISVKEAFGMPDTPPNMMIEGLEPGLPGVPVIKPYHFTRERFAQFLALWNTDLVAYRLEGDPAVGKTSLVLQWHARLNWPCSNFGCSEGTKLHHLMGSLQPQIDGTLRWVDGPLTTAARNGTSVLLDEYNALEPNVTNNLNSILEGYEFTLPTGEVIQPKKGFRVYACQNAHDSDLAVAGRNGQDVANDDRFAIIDVGYLPPVVEKKIVAETIIRAALPRDFNPAHFAQEFENRRAGGDPAFVNAELMVNTATEIRTRFGSAQIRSAIDRPMSLRTLVRWGKLTHAYRGVSARANASPAQRVPALVSLPMSFTMPSKEMRTEVMEIAAAQIGVTL